MIQEFKVSMALTDKNAFEMPACLTILTLTFDPRRSNEGLSKMQSLKLHTKLRLVEWSSHSTSNFNDHLVRRQLFMLMNSVMERSIQVQNGPFELFNGI